MKKKLIYGMFAIILGIGLSAANVSATSYDPTGLAGNIPNPPVAPLILNHGNTGDALFGELYRAVVNDTIGGAGPVNYVTYISIENTSGNWVAAHVRLRSGRFSIEVIDFPILLSPHDVFWFQFEVVPGALITDPPSAVKIWSMDKDTIEKSGLPSLTGAVYDSDTGELVLTLQPYILEQFVSMSDDYKTVLELTQGYVEVFGLFALNFPATRAVNPDHDFYDVMAQLWTDDIGDAVPAGTGAPSYCENSTLGMDPIYRIPAIDVGKVLTGHVFMGDFTNGLYAGYTMKAIKDFRSPALQTTAATGIDRRDFFIRGINNGGVVALPINPATILYAYGTDAAYLEPDWATSFGPTWNDGDNTLGTPVSAVDSFSLDEVDDALVKQRLDSTYFNSGFALTYTVVTVTAPTKYLHYFYNVNSGILDDTAVGPPGNFHWPVGISTTKAKSVRALLLVDDPTVMGNIGLDGAVWNQAQKCLRDASPFTGTFLDWEVNLIPIGEESLAELSDFCYLMLTDPSSPFTLGISSATYPAGIFAMRNFGLQGGITGGDPRNNAVAGVAGYVRGNFPLLNALAGAGLTEIIPVSGQIMDFEFTNFPHARMIDFSWDNIAW